MERAGLITLEQARAAGLSFDEPEPRTCPHCGAALKPLGAALAGKVAWVSAAPCPCEGAAREREAEARRRAALAAKEEAARLQEVLSDKKKAEALLNSPQAQKLMQQLFDNKKK